MSEMKRNRPHFEVARIYQDGSQEIERIELCNLENVLNKGSNLKMARRGFIGLATLSTGVLVVACGTSTAAPTPPPTDTPIPTPPPTGRAPGPGTLDVRVGPGFEYDVSFTLSKGTQFTLSARDSTSSWVEISTSNEQTGWVSVPQIKIDASVSIDSLPISSDYPPQPQPTSGSGDWCTCNQICTCIPVP
jgi:hypothetical protein